MQKYWKKNQHIAWTKMYSATVTQTKDVTSHGYGVSKIIAQNVSCQYNA